jgi:hypothetical protein
MEKHDRVNILEKLFYLETPFFSTWSRRISTKIPGLPRSDPAARSAHAVGPVRRAIHVAAEGIDLRTTKCSSQLSNWMKKRIDMSKCRGAACSLSDI